MARILIADSNSGHANTCKAAISSGYGSDISADITIVADLSTAISTATSDTDVVAILRSYAGVATDSVLIAALYPRVIGFYPLGSNTNELLTVFAEEEPPYSVVPSGAGDTENKNNTGYGNGLEFWDDDLDLGTPDLSSYSNGVILGKLLKIKDTLSCDWWEARFRARATATQTEDNRLNAGWDIYNGYGKIDVSKAVAYKGMIPTHTFYYEDLEIEIEGLEGEIDSLEGSVASLTETNGTLTGQVASLTSQNATLTGQVATLTSANASLTEQVSQLQDFINGEMELHMATSSKFVKFFETTGRVPITTARIWLVPQADAYPTNALELTLDTTRDGQYYRNAVPDGEYKIYMDVDGGTSPVLYTSNIYHAENRLTTEINRLKQISTITADYLALVSDRTIKGDASLGDIDLTLPTAVDNEGITFIIKKVDSTTNSIIVTPESGETIDGNSTIEINSQWDTLTIQSDGTNWIILA